MNSDSRRTQFAPGMTIADRFELLRPLGKGTMGNLWVAHHKTLDIDLALKFIDPELVDRPDLRSRFAQEAMAAARIRSPHVVSVLDFGEAEGNQPYIAMELLEGESLSERLDRETRLSTADTARVLVHACKGLAKAHAQGIVHRDLKPENLFLSVDEEEDGFVLKILDFGIAKAEAPTTGILHRTITGQLVGTPLYMAPEQAVSRPTTPRSDLYSLASVAYHCLTGRPVFDVENIALLLVHLATREPPPLSKHLPNAPEELEVWFRKALHKEPEERFGSARELAESFALACQTAGAIELEGLSLPPRPGDRARESWGEVTPPPAPRFSTPVLKGEPISAVPSTDGAVRASTPGAGDTLVDEGIINANRQIPESPALPAAAKVRIVQAGSGQSEGGPPSADAQALGLAPTIRDQSGAIREIVERAANRRPAPAPEPPIPPRTSPVPSTQPRASSIDLVDGEAESSPMSTLLWVVGAVLAIGVAVAVGWFIGRTL